MMDFSDTKALKAAIKPNTKVVWAETPTNPTLKICDIAAVAKVCKEKNVIFVVDNTFYSPYLQVSFCLISTLRYLIILCISYGYLLSIIESS
jgi:cystathionine beta-lyase/cystathionine gamma-synthase